MSAIMASLVMNHTSNTVSHHHTQCHITIHSVTSSYTKLGHESYFEYSSAPAQTKTQTQTDIDIETYTGIGKKNAHLSEPGRRWFRFWI